MNYEKEYNFVVNFLNKLNIQTTLFNIDEDEAPKFDLGLRETIYDKDIYKKFFSSFPSTGKPNTIYHINDKFLCQYFVIQLPNDPGTYFMAGPYTDFILTDEVLLKLADQYNLSPQIFAQLKKYYTRIPFIKDKEYLLSLFMTFGESLWDGVDNYSIEKVNPNTFDYYDPATNNEKVKKESPILVMNTLEARYKKENDLFQAVSKGLMHKAELYMLNNRISTMETRLNDPIRDIKNYTIILKTVLRLAAEQGKVHPIYIDALSSQFAKQIEAITSIQSGLQLQMDMVKEYCLLVKKHSSNNYSLPIQRVITYIDTDLTADLSLKALSDSLNINSSYLSTLFKKETSMTLTNYVNKKRIEHAVYLLSSTDMQIQKIAQYCGIPDVNYFTKIFKKVMNKTPSEFKEEMR